MTPKLFIQSHKGSSIRIYFYSYDVQRSTNTHASPTIASTHILYYP